MPRMRVRVRDCICRFRRFGEKASPVRRRVNESVSSGCDVMKRKI
jgi:hypothetical protein